MRKPFTTLLYLLVIFFLIYWPYYMNLYEKEQMQDKKHEEEEFRGIITFWDFPHPSIEDPGGFEFIKRKIEVFQYKYPGVVIDFEPLSYENGYKKLINSSKEGSLPDILPVGADFYFISNGYLSPITKYIDEELKKQYKEGVIDALKYKGNIYGMPLGMYTNVLFLNVDMFYEKEIKLPENGEWNYEEFMDSMIKLTYSEGKQDKKFFYGLGISLKPNNYNLWGFLLLDGARVFDEEKYSFFGPQAVSGVEKVLDLFNKYKVVNPVSLEGDREKLWQDFITTKNTAVLVEESYKIAQLKNLQSKGKLFEFDVAMYPEGESGIPLTLSPKIYAYGIKKEKNEKKLEMEYKFIKFLTEDQQKAIELGYVPVKKDKIIEDDKMKVIELATKYTNAIPQIEGWGKINNTVISKIKEGIKNNKNAFDITEEIKNSVNQLVQQE
ncbi:ABC transporter substrate-binding protein [Thermoanaerobacter mathranii]|uniref:ABC transporter substrate-binding protein n=1 Tax=Thermoanaerobacter mathranii TaxID=583357 RepID=UPI003AADE75F